MEKAVADKEDLLQKANTDFATSEAKNLQMGREKERKENQNPRTHRRNREAPSLY